MLPTKFRIIWLSGFRGEHFHKSTKQKQILHVAALFINGSGQLSNLYRRTHIDASYQVSVNLARWFQRRRFIRNQPIRNNNCLCGPCFSGSERNEQS
jgi:hypothetical protein